ncbi:ATP-dependent (S)-NAD(P)H-hydrate dehydratase, partial [Trichinella nativa]
LALFRRFNLLKLLIRKANMCTERHCEVLEVVRRCVPKLEESNRKGQNGRICVIGGSYQYTGAPYFAAISALKTGADLSFVICAPEAGQAIKAYSPELIVFPVLTQDAFADVQEEVLSRVDVIIIGPGIGRRAELVPFILRIVCEMARTGMPIVVDADGLNAVMTNLDAIRGLKNIVMTPNATEFDRLFKAEFEGRVIVTEDTLGAVKLLAAKLQNVTIVRKGPTDIISDGIHVLECAEPCSLRRCGGQGDVLSGVLGTFLHWTKRNSELFVESNSGGAQYTPTLVAAYGACRLTRESSRCAFERHRRGMVASDMVREIPQCFARLFPDSQAPSTSSRSGSGGDVKAAILATSGSGLAPACVDVRPQLTFSSIVVIGGQRSHPSQTPFRPKRCSFYSLFLHNLKLSTLRPPRIVIQEEEPTLPVAMDFTEKLPADICRRVFRYVDLKQRTKAERVSKRWREIVLDAAAHDDRSVWLYVIFREGHLSGHDRMTVRVSYDGPIFWDKSIVYVYLCSCHAYERHEKQLISLFKRIANSVHRLCLVSSPVRSPFLTNDFYTFILDIFKNLQILYLRELNLENVATTTVERLATSKTLSRVVVHDCIHYDSLTDYHRLNNRLMLVKGHLRGLEDLLRSKNAYPEDSEDLPISTVQNRPESNISNMINGLTIDSSSPVDAA